MTKLLIDAGTSWSKILELYTDSDDLKSSPLNEYAELFSQYTFDSGKTEFLSACGEAFQSRFFLLPTKTIAKISVLFDKATGHMTKNHIKSDGSYENEVIALAYGAKKILNNPDNALILDLGSRDAKWIKFKDGKYRDLDWNSNCGSATGATVEMLCKFYNVNPSEIEVSKDKISVICGVFSMEKIMDAIAAGVSAEEAIAKYIHGIAYNTWSFARKPDKIYLSGGFCENTCFIKSLELYCKVETLGRFVLLEGLY